MNTREQLNHYLSVLEKRLRWLAISKGIAIAAGVALGATLALVLITNALAFSDASLLGARIVLFLALAAALGYALVLPLTRLNRTRAATRAEVVFPQFDQRLLTYVERKDSGDPMIELLADDTQRVAQKTAPEDVAPPKSLFAFATGAGAAGAALIWMILAGPGFLGYGASLLWAGSPKSGVGAAFYDIQVQPGNKLVRRKDDVPISATLIGFQAQSVRMFAKYQSSSKWEEANMLPRDNGSAYEFRFAALPEPVEYYIEAGAVKSKTFKLDVTDLPGITHIKTTYHFPSWLGLPDHVEDPSGDLRAVAGTVAEVAVTTDRPLKNGVIEMEDGSQIPLSAGANGTLTAKIPMTKSGLYHFAAVDQGQSVRLSPLDYFIEAQDDEAPTVRISHPGADAKVLPIEEVTIDVTGQDDFALQGLDVHYSVNGAPEKTVPLLTNKGAKTADGRMTLALEDFKLQPGDVVSVYATARDARNTSQTDILFIEAQAYERNYTQSQQSGGGGGGGGGGGQEQQQIWDRQKQVVTATYNATRPNDKTKTQETADYLSATEKTLKAQAESLADRMKSRELDESVAAEFKTVIDEMKAAGADMATASDKLTKQGWKDAISPEESALRHLEHAQAAQRDIQVAFGRQGGGGGGGGGGGNAGRDLANLFDLELDTEKNQYEQQGSSSSAEEQQKKIDDAMAKLDELAKRQQELAQQPRTPQNAAQQRYQQEQLMKQAEQLKQQLQAMQQQQGGQQSQSQGQQSSQGSQGQSSGQTGQTGQQSSQQTGQQQASQQQQNGKNPPKSQQQQAQNQNGRTNNANAQTLQQTLDRLKQAEDAMRASNQAAEQGQQGDPAAQANARKAAQALGDANSVLRGMQQQDAAGKVNELADRASQLDQEQHALEDRVKQEFGDINSRDKTLQDRGMKAYQAQQQKNGAAQQSAEQIAKEEEKLAGEMSKLVDDARQAERSLRTAQPNAASRLREGVADAQQTDTQRRIENMATYARSGYGPMMSSSEAPISQSIDDLKDQFQKAQQAVQGGQQQGAARDQQQRALQQSEQARSALEALVQQGQPGGQQPGNQPGQGKQGGQQPGQGQAQGKQGQGQGQGQGSGGQQPGQGNQPGNQPGGQQARAGGGGNNAGAFNGGPNGGGYFGPNGGATIVNPGLGANRNYPQGMYDAPENRAINPALIGREVQGTLRDLQQALRDDPDAEKALADLEKQLEQVRFGETASPELAERISRTVLPQWDSFEVQLRRKLEESGAGQAKTAAPDKIPPGYDANVQAYTKKLSDGK
jgi:hypothetical protein